jgi:cytochrome c-type biogenesis protein CcmF
METVPEAMEEARAVMRIRHRLRPGQEDNFHITTSEALMNLWQSISQGIFSALIGLVSRARRRYGGYLVHTGIAIMFFGFTGAAYDVERERAAAPGTRVEVGRDHGPLHSLRYDQPRMESDPNKRAIYTDLTLMDGTEAIDVLSPAKFIYRTHPEMPTTEVHIRSRPLEDLYVIMATVDPESRLATFRVVVRPFVLWIWLGGLVLIFGALLGISPTIAEVLGREEGAADGKPKAKGPPTAAAVAVLIALLAGTLLLGAPSRAEAQNDSSSTLHAGSVEIRDPTERRIFDRLLCRCGDCARLTLSTCGCSWAEDMRAEVRAKMADGVPLPEIESDYRARWGAIALAIPPDEGLGRLVWAVPVAAGVLAIGGIFWMGVRRRARSAPATPGPTATGGAPASDAEKKAYDDALAEELRRMEEE